MIAAEVNCRDPKNTWEIVGIYRCLDTLGEWVVQNGMKINPGKSKATRFTTVLG